jgi:hypothetical protein
MALGDLPNDFIGNPRTFSETREMELLHLSAAANVMHQIERISFAAHKSHDVTSKSHLYV